MLWMLMGLVIFVSAALLLARLCYRIAFFNANLKEQDAYLIPPGKQHAQQAEKHLQLIHEVNILPYEQVFIPSSDGMLLAGKYYHVKDGAPMQILFHGFHSSAVRDMCGLAKLARKLGFNVLLVDQRAHGKSEGHTITFGVVERYDCLEWCYYAVERFGHHGKILLVGLSMGAATVLMASELELPQNVAGIIADCPYASPAGIIDKVSRSLKIPGWLAYPFVALGARVYGHFGLRDSSAVKAVRNTEIPILLLHGEADRLVPCDMSVQIYNACRGPRQLETIPGAGHGLSYLVDPVRYEAAVKAFLESNGIL